MSEEELSKEILDDTKKYKIQQAVITDASEISENILSQVFEIENKNLDKNTVKKSVERFFNDPTKGQFYIVKMENQIIAQLLITSEWDIWYNKDSWKISTVYVKPGYRKCGYFKVLFNYVKEKAYEFEISYLSLVCHDENKNAHATFEKLGMSTEYKYFQLEL